MSRHYGLTPRSAASRTRQPDRNAAPAEGRGTFDPAARPERYVYESTPGGAFAAGHGPLGRAAPAATTPQLNWPRRSEREFREGRRPAAELDDLLGARPLLALDTLAVWRAAPPASSEAPPSTPRRGGVTGAAQLKTAISPGRLVVTLNASGDLWIVAWQNAASGKVLDGQFHRDAAAAFEDLAGRCRRAGRHGLRPAAAGARS